MLDFAKTGKGNVLPEPNRHSGALVLHVYRPVECLDCDEEDHSDGGHTRCSVCSSVDESECFDREIFERSVAVKAAFAFSLWQRSKKRWAW